VKAAATSSRSQHDPEKIMLEKTDHRLAIET
jgi:hypothetical protein